MSGHWSDSGVNKVTSVISDQAMDGREEYGEYSLASPGYRGSMASYPGQYPGQQIQILYYILQINGRRNGRMYTLFTFQATVRVTPPAGAWCGGRGLSTGTGWAWGWACSAGTSAPGRRSGSGGR